MDLDESDLSGTVEGVECLQGDTRLADDRCGLCECEEGVWTCPQADTSCEVQCDDASVVPGPGNCGWCTCIEDAWICDRTEECECEYVAAAYDPNGCSQRCSPFGAFENGCGTSGGVPFDGDVPGLDPFATEQVVPCEPQVPLLDDDSGTSWVDAASLSGTELTITIAFEGGCAEHRFGLCFAPQTYGDFGDGFEHIIRTVGLDVAHRTGGDICGMSQSVTRTFDITPAREVYERRMDDHGLERGDRMLLNVRALGDFYNPEPISYVFHD